MILLTWLLATVWAAGSHPQIDSIYMIMVDRFSNGRSDNDAEIDPTNTAAFHGGDIAGVTANLDFIEQLGANTVWLSPITKMRTTPIDGHGAFHGYWLENGRRLEPRFGTLADLSALTSALASRGMGLIVDQVLNHVGPDTPLTRTHPDWFHGQGDITDWNDPAQLVDHDVHGLPDLDHTNAQVVKHLVSDGQYWLKHAQPTGFRVDAVRHLDPGFLKLWISRLSAQSEQDLVFLGEVFDGNPVTLARRIAGTGLTHSFDFPLHYALIESICKGGDLRRIAAVLSQDRRYEPGLVQITFLDNHDTPRVATVCAEKTQDAFTWLTSLRGVPAITWGTAAGLTGETETEARGDMVFKPTPLKAHITARLDDRRAYSPLVHGHTDILKATPTALVVARVMTHEAVVIATDETDGTPVLPAQAGPVHWIPISGGQVRRWLITPKSKGSFEAWVQKISADQNSTVTVQIKAAADSFISGSDPALGGWDTSAAAGPGDTTVALPTGGMVAVKTFKRTETGDIIWSQEADRFIDVDAIAITGDAVSLGR